MPLLELASFPGPAQLFVAYSTEKRERAWDNWGEPERAPLRRVCCKFSIYIYIYLYISRGNRTPGRRRCNGLQLAGTELAGTELAGTGHNLCGDES